eukprot:scaffold135941_cov329-Phaeocystis_antarctica.AAC.1
MVQSVMLDGLILMGSIAYLPPPTRSASMLSRLPMYAPLCSVYMLWWEALPKSTSKTGGDGGGGEGGGSDLARNWKWKPFEPSVDSQR